MKRFGSWLIYTGNKLVKRSEELAEKRRQWENYVSASYIDDPSPNLTAAAGGGMLLMMIFAALTLILVIPNVFNAIFN